MIGGGKLPHMKELAAAGLMSDLTVIELTMSLDEARSVTTRIRQHLAVAWVEIVKAYDGRAWLVLGYASWDAYCAEEFAGQRIRLPREDRQEVVSSLRESGLSIRAIAAATGADTKTVQSDIAAGVGNSHTSSTANELVDKQAEALVLDDDVVEAELVEERAAPAREAGSTNVLCILDGRRSSECTRPQRVGWQRLGDGRLLCHRPTVGGTGRVSCSAEARRRIATRTRKCPDTPNVGAPPWSFCDLRRSSGLSDPRKSFPRVGGQRPLRGRPLLRSAAAGRSTLRERDLVHMNPVSVRDGMCLRAVFARILLRDLPRYTATLVCVIKAPLMSADPEFAAGLGPASRFGCRYPGRTGDLAFGGCDAERTFPAERQARSEFHGVMMRSPSGRRQGWGYGLTSCGN
jgi:hypothetical protein